MEIGVLNEGNDYEEHIEENIQVDDNLASVLDMEIANGLENREDSGVVIASKPKAIAANSTKVQTKKVVKKKYLRLPLNKVKSIMKLDPDCTIVSAETVFLVTKATEMFLEYLGRQSAKTTLSRDQKTITRKDVDAAIETIPHLCFLDGAIE